MELQDEPDYEAFAQDVNAVSEELDPVSKVVQWQQIKPATAQAGNIPSGYGSISTSPTMPNLQAPHTKKVSSERSSFEHGSPGDMDSGCPGSERSPSTLFFHQQNPLVLSRNLSHVAEEVPVSSEERIHEIHSITDLSSDERVDLEISKLKEHLNVSPKRGDHSSHNSTLVLDPALATKSPRGSHTILAQQIDQEINELRNFFEDHREEMLSLISEQGNKKSLTSAGCSPIVFENQAKSPKRSNSKRRSFRRNQLISDSEESHDVQEERRQEFEKFRNQKKQRRKPQFALGQPLSNERPFSGGQLQNDQFSNGQLQNDQFSNVQKMSTEQNFRISALFPRVDDDSNRSLPTQLNVQNSSENSFQNGRHVPTYDGDQVFIPKLNLDDQWSMEDKSVTLTATAVPEVKEVTKDIADKSCQVDSNLPQKVLPETILPKQKPRRKKHKKSKVSTSFNMIC